MGDLESLPNQTDRMKFVSRIAKDFNRLMDKKLDYMESQLRVIREWIKA